MRTSTNTGQVTWGQRLNGIWTLLHPIPSLVTALAYLIFAFIAARGHPPLVKLLLTTLGMVSIQFAISTLNDYCDREADRQSTKFKPIVQGLVSPQAALWLTGGFTLLMVICYLPFGLGPFALAVFALGLGVAYDLGVKRTPFSGVMLGLEFPTLPLLAWALFAKVQPALYWTYALGLSLGIAIHLADALPDAATDAQAGAHGLTQFLGKSALAVCWGCCAFAILITALLGASGLVHARLPLLLSSDAVAVGLLGIAIATYRRPVGTHTAKLRANFWYVVGVAFVTAISWLVAAVVS
jgi:4-hydroxybenzoate polyprenyltransferase